MGKKNLKKMERVLALHLIKKHLLVPALATAKPFLPSANKHIPFLKTLQQLKKLALVSTGTCGKGTEQGGVNSAITELSKIWVMVGFGP
ncbi:hypothetical protein DY000_02056956 [Brassica cretica]|uniref:Uncharacterized protein n=1 Tax=Brassica cretica TaxID=69181 RepID=A0ABQ7AM06_BRACR|nr:hypothetical protein DY000_02056956 [Brassica cretica]